ncbi:unknown protein [Seminavis robusta]|uniref:Uncharacterized protein n=1 Tax=Seminavis robusta TaxID=568900 RepID=A0A9N8ELV0_9STRA|nr:unknown protein [Seminavis robusta]|eukprot:Sro1219_g253450.1 n/a (193) ;mRNA; r:26937-27515
MASSIDTLSDDVWTGNILPFLGMGQYAYIGASSWKLNNLYKRYCDSDELVDRKPLVKVGRDGLTKAGATSTFYSTAFFNLGCAEYWATWANDNEALWTIAKHGSLELLQWAWKKFPRGDSTPSRIITALASRGHVESIKWVIENGCEITHICYSPWNAAARGGHLETLKWAYRNGQSKQEGCEEQQGGTWKF